MKDTPKKTKSKQGEIRIINMDNILGIKNRFLSIFLTIKLYRNWPAYFYDIFCPSLGNFFTLNLKNGIKYILRSGTIDKFVIKETWGLKSYTPPGFKFSSNCTILDIGAQIGAFTLFASHNSRSSRIIAVEPVPENVALLNLNVSVNHLNNVTVLPLAISSKKGITKIFLNPNNTAGHSLYSKLANSSNFIVVPTITLENLIESQEINRIDFFKIDCEGSEYEMLFNLPKKYFHLIFRIVMEVHDLDNKRNYRTMANKLSEMGYEVTVFNNPKLTMDIHFLWATRK